MNLRYEILAAVAKNPGAPSAEICDVIDYDRQKVQYSVRECTKAGLLSMRRDDVTGQPGYTLTKDGQTRLDQGPEPLNKVGLWVKPKSTSSTNVQPAVTHNTGSSASVPASATPAEGAAVQPEPAPETPADVSTAALAAEDDIPALSVLAVSENAWLRSELAKVEADLQQIHALLAHRVAGPIDPNDLGEVECAEKAAEMIDASVDEISRALTAVREKDDELVAQAGVVVDLRDQLANQTALVAKLERLLQSARNEAEHLRRHAAQGDGDPVNHPAHYQGKVECIDAIESALGPDGFAAYCRGNAIKYAYRAGRKGPAAQDMAKAQWYLARATETASG